MFSMRCPLIVRNLLAVNTSGSSNTNGRPGTTAGAVVGISTCSVQLAQFNYYEALGIPQSSTQNDIKAAYYRLSKQFHPDKNQGCENAAQKFREITQAYEVLGNFKLRRLYDKGIIHTAGPQYAHSAASADEMAAEVEDDPQTKFYKSRFKKSTVADMSGRTPIYDFDAWSKAHYGHSFQRKQQAKTKYEKKQVQKASSILNTQNEILIMTLFFTVVVIYAIFREESSHDTPKQRAIKAAQERLNNANNRTND